MKITILSVGKIKEEYFRLAIDEYSKRLTRYCKLNLIEVADEKTLDQASEAEEQIILEKEASRILKNIKDDMFVVVLAIEGTKLTSVQLSDLIEKLGVQGTSHICFIIGGSLGLHKTVMDKANFKLSFSNMTFPHQLMKVILLEQIYRSYRILSNEPYHK